MTSVMMKYIPKSSDNRHIWNQIFYISMKVSIQCFVIFMIKLLKMLFQFNGFIQSNRIEVHREIRRKIAANDFFKTSDAIYCQLSQYTTVDSWMQTNQFSVCHSQIKHRMLGSHQFVQIISQNRPDIVCSVSIFGKIKTCLCRLKMWSCIRSLHLLWLKISLKFIYRDVR